MSNPEEISHLVAPIEIDIGWACTLCHEGIEYTDSIVRHSCGLHLFHCSCLSIKLLENPECPTCHSLGPGTIAQMNNIKLGIYNARNNYNQICTKCLGTIDRFEGHVKLIKCKHRLHINCALDIILETGISHKGIIFCTFCHE